MGKIENEEQDRQLYINPHPKNTNFIKSKLSN